MEGHRLINTRLETLVTLEEFKTILSAYAERALADAKPKPELRIEADRFEDDEHASLSADVDFLFDEGDAEAERAARRALKQLQRLVQRDSRVKWDGTGSGPDVLGITVVVDLGAPPPQ
jgi:hypothetical protein